MTRYVLAAFAIALLVTTSCRKPTGTPTSSLVFGSFAGMCAGDCAHIYQLKDNNLYSDNITNFYSQPVSFKPDALSAAQYNIARRLRENFPKYLKEHPNTTIGSPDSHDQGGFFLQFTEAGVTTSWRVDTDDEMQPAEIRAYMADVGKVLNELN